MIAIDMKMPEKCVSCPFSRIRDHGTFQGEWICTVMLHRQKTLPESVIPRGTVNYKRPENCPLMEVMERA